MIQKEFYRTREDGVNLYCTYSDNRLMIRQIDTNELYEEAIDVEDSMHSYEETEFLIKEDLE